jgi:hypothetical protein
MCQTVAPRSRQASVIAAANLPEEMLVMRRTSSIGAIVAPPVTTTFIGAVLPCGLLRDRAQAASLAWLSPTRSRSKVRANLSVAIDHAQLRRIG